MAMRSMDLNPKFPGYYQEIGVSGNNGFIICDVGARDGIEPYWNSIVTISKFFAFDADTAECERLNRDLARNKNIDIHFYPYAIHRDNKKRTFYITNFSYSCGFDLADPIYIERFPNYRAVSKKAEIELDTINLDYFFKKHHYSHLDFIKVDVEGSELAVFEGAMQSLKEKCVLGLKSEFWWEPMIKNQPSFAEMDIYLREQGFRFFDLQLHYYSRNALPGGIGTQILARTATNINIGFTREGQAMTGDAIYFRDPVHEFKTGQFTIEWNDHNILRLAGLYCIFGYYDSAIELVQFYRDKFTLDLDVDKLIDLFLPPVDGHNLTYKLYHELSENYCKQEYASMNIPWDVPRQTKDD